LVLV
jgi:hypothetical protein